MLVCIVVACTGWLDLAWVGDMSGLAGGLLKGWLELLLVLVIMLRVTVWSRLVLLLVFFLLCVVVIWVRIRERWWRGRMTRSFLDEAYFGDLLLLLDRCLLELQSGDGDDLQCLVLVWSFDLGGLDLGFRGWLGCLRTSLALWFVCFGLVIADFRVGMLTFALRAVIGCFDRREDSAWSLRCKVCHHYA